MAAVEPAPPKSSLYTRSGDGGVASLYTGERRAKDDVVFAALGDVDELNSLARSVGLALEFCLQAGNGLDEQLCEVMSRLFDVGSAVATPPGNSVGAAKLAHTRFGPRPCELLESWLDAHDAALPPLRAFILPSGGSAAAALHAARAVCRRAERAVVPLVRCGDVEEAVGAYLNRLSDYLFVAARTAAARAGAVETTYKKQAEA